MTRAEKYEELLKFVHWLTKQGCSFIEDPCISCMALAVLRRVGDKRANL